MRSGLLQVVASTDRRGAEVFAVGLEKALAGRGRSVQTMALAPGRVESDTLPIRTLGRAPLAPSTLLALHRQLRRGRIAIAHGSNTLPACAVASLGSGTPFVYRNIGDPRYWAGRGSRRARVSLFLSRASAVAVLWGGAADSFMAAFGVPRHKVRIIPNGVPAALFPAIDDQSRAAARSRLSCDVETPLVLYLGALSPEKNVADAIRAVGLVPGVALLVVGDGSERAKLEALAGEVAPTRVQFLGTLPDSAVALAAADVLVLASSTEGIPACLIEAGMSELPVVATNVGGVAEVVVHDETGLLVPPGDVGALADGLRRVLAGPTTLGQAARARCLANFEMEVVAKAWEQLLQDLGAS